jgi:hypothetical protein
MVRRAYFVTGVEVGVGPQSTVPQKMTMHTANHKSRHSAASRLASLEAARITCAPATCGVAWSTRTGGPQLNKALVPRKVVMEV